MDAHTVPLPGRLLVATPDLHDPNFRQSVVYLLAHGDDGSLGVIVNRPGEVPVDQVIPALADAVTPPPTMFAGGPVRPDGVIALAHVDEDVEGVGTVAPGVGVVDLEREPLDVTDRVDELRLFAGHAGWVPGQLDQELASGGWFVVDGRPEDVFAAEPEDLWERVLRRQGGVFTTATADPSIN